MKEIMMTIHTTAENESSVTVNAKFADHATAVRFHEGLAALVKNHSGGKDVTAKLHRKLLGYAS